MGVCDLLRQEQAVARDRVRGVEVGFREDTWGAEARERRHRERHLRRLQVLAREVTTSWMGGKQHSG